MSGSKIETGNETVPSSYPDWDVEALLERIWSQLGGTVSRPSIRQVLAEVIPNYESAPVQTFVPIFVHKHTVERLRNGLPSPQETPEGSSGRCNSLCQHPATFSTSIGTVDARKQGSKV